MWAHNATYGDLPNAADPKHTLFRNLLDQHGYKEIKGKIFKNGEEIGQTHIDDLTRLYRQNLASEISPTIDRIQSGSPRTHPVTVEIVTPGGDVRSVENVRITHPRDGSEHFDLSGRLAKAVGSDGPMPNEYWSEWVHLPQRQVGSVDHPGAHRVIQGKNGEVFYTTDHYETYTLVAREWSDWGVFGK